MAIKDVMEVREELERPERKLASSGERIKFDGVFNIATGKSRKSKTWKNNRVSWSKILQRLAKTTRTAERYVDFVNMPKEKQDEIKDIGGFVGGEIKEGRRIASNIVSRQIVALDADYAPYEFWNEVTALNDYACCVYSTHKHSTDNPRYRLIIPLDRPVSPDEYQAISRKIADGININYFDDTTYQAHRLMYYPSTAKDGEFVFEYQDGPFLSADDVLDTYEDWTDQTEWAISDRAVNGVTHAVTKQENPLEKDGIVGAFCRAYDIDSAIEAFLSDVYAPCDAPNRYTYTQGSSSGGAVVYDNMFLYSHHATDPCSMQLCNAFDLVRMHKFSELDARSRATETQKLPSYLEMCKFASNDGKVKTEIAKTRLAEAGREFEDLSADGENLEWAAELETHPKTGAILNTRKNIEIIMKNDAAIKGVFGYEQFSQRIAIKRRPAWRDGSEGMYWNDNDEANLRTLLETSYKIDNKLKVDDCILTVANDNSFHVIREYLSGLEWDGVERMETLLIDYLGAEDNTYTREVTRKLLVAAVARVFSPGVKFDTMPVLVGAQGLGKSYLLKKLGGRWFSDSITSLQGKEAFEQLRGVWIEEFSELSAMRKADIEAIKQYVTKQVDTYRPAYAKCLMDFPRQCVFVGTTNTENFLRDKTGNRRFLPVEVGVDIPTRSLFADDADEYIAQVWAEAKRAYDDGEKLILEGEAAKIAKQAQSEHMEENPLEGVLLEYLDRPVPANWYDLDIRARRDFIRGAGFEVDMTDAFVRDKICVMEVWCELLGGDIKNFDSYDRKEIRETLNMLEGWAYDKKATRFGREYGVQKAWRRK